jgi:hypothetical protein
MLELLRDVAFREAEYLRRRYAERATHFDATLAFLRNSDIVRKQGKDLQLIANEIFSELSRANLQHVLLQRLIARANPFRDEVLSYLRQFRIVGGKAAHRPTTEQRSGESDLRNFLMELGVVNYDKTNRQYLIAFDHYTLFIQAVRPVFPLGPLEFRKRQKGNEDLGLAAETEIVKFELQRIGKQFADRVIHVAATDVSAGYDIESITVDSEDQLSPRFIEVKAVSLDDYRFFWTANELALARSLGSWYYLYLLPTTARREFLINLLRIVPDPAFQVLECQDEWSVEGNVLECKMKGN